MSDADTQTSTGTIEEATSKFEALLGGEEPNQEPEGNEAETADDAEADAAAETPEETSDEGDDAGAEDEAAAEDEEAEQPPLTPETPVTVKIDGQDVQVPLSEALAGYQRQADYTRKTQQLAADRNQFLAEVQQLRSERQVYSQLLGALEQQVQATTAHKDANYWANLRDADPLRYSIEYTDHQRDLEKAAAIRSEQERLRQSEAQEQAQQMRSYIAEESQKLLQAVPKWSDPKVRAAELQEVRQYAKETFGYTDEMLNQAYDHRAIVAMHKAMLYDRLVAKTKGKAPQQGKPQAQPQQARPVAVQRKAPLAAPTSANRPPRQVTELTKAKQSLAKTGHVNDAAKVFEKLLG